MIHAVKRAAENPDNWLMRCAIVASLIAVFYFSGDKAKDWGSWAILCLIGVAAVGFHYRGAANACAAWYDRAPLRFLGWATVVGVAFAWEVNSQISIGSQNQANLTQARLTSHNSSQIAQRQLATAEEKLANLTSEQAWKATGLKPADAYNPDIERARSHRMFTASNGCTDVKGKQMRDHCDAFRKAESDRAMAIRRGQLSSEIANAELAVASAREAVGKSGITANGSRADFNGIKRLTGMSSDDIEIGQSLLMVAVLGAFLTLAGWLLKAREYEGKPRKPWINWASIHARLNGQDPHRQSVPREIVHSTDDTAWAQAILKARA